MRVTSPIYQKPGVAFSSAHIKMYNTNRARSGPRDEPYGDPPKVSDPKGLFLCHTGDSHYEIRRASDPELLTHPNKFDHCDGKYCSAAIARTGDNEKIYSYEKGEMGIRDFRILGILNGEGTDEQKVAQVGQIYDRFDITEDYEPNRQYQKFIGFLPYITSL